MAKYEESEEYFLRLKSIVELTDAAIIGMDLNGTVFSWNNGAKVLYGYSPAEVVGKSISIIVPLEHQNEFADTLERIKRPEKDKAYDTLRIRKDGTRIEVSVIVSPIINKIGEIVGVSSIARDITERKHAKVALQESGRRFKNLFDAMNSGVAIYAVRNDGESGADYVIQDFNNKALEIEGKSRADVVGRSLLDLRPAIDSYGLIPVFRQVWKTGEPAFYPSKIYVDEHYSNWYENTVFRLPSGEIVAIYNDVTDKMRTTEGLLESEKKYRLLVDSATEAIMVAQDGMLRLVNPKTVTMTGFSEQELTSKPFSSLIHPDDRAMVVERYQKRLRGEAVPDQYAFRVLTKDGSTKWVEISAVMIEWEGRPATLNFLTDVTERKRAEEELRRMTADAFESGQKAEAYFDFLAHDIANILSPMIAYADMLKSRPNDPNEVIRFSDKILEQGKRASSLISNLRRLESIEKTHPNEIDSIDLRTLFSSLEDDIRSGFPDKEVAISYDIPDVQSMNVKGGEWVENVFKCVYDNAVRYSTGSDVELEIRASMLQQEGKEPCWQIEVSDHGPGIPDNVKGHFEDSISVADREFKGVASSLPFCVSMIRCLGGELLIQDRTPGDHRRGTRVTIRLPKGE